MYPWTKWTDEVVENPTHYLVDGEDAVITGNHGETLQEGTPQDEEHFNILEAGIVDAHIALQFLLAYARQNAWTVERGSVTLENSLAFPFNDSEESVSLSEVRESTDYVVIPEVASFDGNVGEVVIRDKLTNGFKLSYTGSASSATINYTVIGGYFK